MQIIQKRILTLDDVRAISHKLGARLSAYAPDVVVSVETGGWYTGALLAKQFDVPHFPITVRRFDDEELQRLYSAFPQSLRWLPIIYQGVLQKMRTPYLQRGVVCVGAIEGKRVLLIDDAVHTGATFAVAKQYVTSLAPSALQLAALASVRGTPASIMTVLRGNYVYPWSRISREYQRFLRLHQQRQII